MSFDFCKKVEADDMKSAPTWCHGEKEKHTGCTDSHEPSASGSGLKRRSDGMNEL